MIIGSSRQFLFVLVYILCQQVPLAVSLIRLASWNLLAPVYSPRYKYPWCAKEHLSWEHRKPLIAEKLLQAEADVICLQEVQIEHWRDMLDCMPRYEGILQNVTRDHPVASAVLYDPLKLEISRVESRSRALIVVLSEIMEMNQQSNSNLQAKNGNLYLANVHLEAGQGHDCNLTRYNQLKSLWKRLSNHIRQDNIPLQDAPIVLAGDFNMLHGNPLHTFLSRGLLQNPTKKFTLPTTITKLQDAYLTSTSNESSNRLEKTFARGSVLDYIWTSDRVTVEECLVLDPQVLKKEAQLWPSHDHPSDHLPIGAILKWS
jgi:mRNA deadenylase 3'-5' endonuclease subunit Ccr4